MEIVMTTEVHSSLQQSISKDSCGYLIGNVDSVIGGEGVGDRKSNNYLRVLL